MSRKKRTQALSGHAKPEEFQVNPFAELDLDLPDVPQEEFPKKNEESRKHPPAPEKRAELGAEDHQLLQAFQHEADVDAAMKGLTVRLAVERKGRRGKTVTLLRGLEDLDVLEQMEICRELRCHLGTGGRFDEGVLELQGDQRRRAGDWLQAQGYRVKGI